jgi:hypothetical protein
MATTLNYVAERMYIWIWICGDLQGLDPHYGSSDPIYI